MTVRLRPGSPEPLGVTPGPGGVNVAVFSAHAERMWLCLFDAAGDQEIERVALPERSGAVFHGFVPDVAVGQRYGLRADGPWRPEQGHVFNPAKLLLDPYAVQVDRPWSLHASQFGFVPGQPDRRDTTDSAPHVPKAIVTAPHASRPGRAVVPWRDTVVQEIHVRGLTMRHPGVPEARRGTFAGLAQPAVVEHFVRQGVTTLELMPAMAWLDERHLPPLGLTNAWGYNPVGFLAPDPRLAPGGWDEVAGAVAALHAAGIEVILDVVYNHTAESDAFGPTVSLRGLDQASYYRMTQGAPRRLVNDTGCGNTLALDNPAMLRLALDSMRQWAGRAGIDGFRFDLAATLGRRADGFDPAHPFLSAVAQDPMLRELKLVAEPWDIGPGGYQPGNFPDAWGEWNDAFRDDVRRFWRGEPGRRGSLATRLAGSQDLFGRKRRPSRSVNFVTAHDGFTLADLVSYEAKRNAANGEDNRDGTNANHSWNNGAEGPTDDPAILAARARDQRALLATLFAARGTPMLSMGSELGFSQGGNNNAYAQDNETTWLDWDHADDGLARFAARCAALRRDLPLLRQDRFLTGAAVEGGDLPDVDWRDAGGATLDPGRWADGEARALVMILAGSDPDRPDEPPSRVAVALNAGKGDVPLHLPPAQPGARWSLRLDSADPERSVPAPVPGRETTLPARAVLVIAEEADPGQGGIRRAAGASGRELERLASAVGIAKEWWEETGVHHVVSPETCRALLACMGIAADTDAEARDALESVAARRDRRALPQSIAAVEGRPASIALGAVGSGTLRLAISGEDGNTRLLDLDSGALPRTSREAADGRIASQALAPLPLLPPGRYEVLREDAPGVPCRLTVAPAACYRPPLLDGGRRLWGVAAHLYTVRRAGDHGIGDFGALAGLAEAAAGRGATIVGLNPLHVMPPDDRERASPYNPLDRRFLDPIYIDLATLGDADPDGAARRVVADLSADLDALSSAPAIDYPGVWAIKEHALRAAFAGFERLSLRNPDDHAVRAFRAFVREGGAALDRFACFQAIASGWPGERWTQWPAPLRDPGSPAVDEAAARAGTEKDFSLWTQWLCDRQLAEAARRGHAAGLSLGLYRDLAVGAAPDSAEAWAGGAAFGRGASVGSPPDLFSRDGQVWALPPPSPLAMEADGGAWFAGLVAANMRHAGALRIDHAMALQRLFWVPEGARPADGAYVAYPREALIGQLALESHRARCMVVGEDLGTVPEGFRQRLDEAGVLSYRVLWFERSGEGFIPPRDYPGAAAACVSTHDLPTLAGWWRAADVDERAALGLFSAEEAQAGRAARLAEKAVLLATLRAAGLDPGPADPAGPLSPAIAAAVHAFVAATPCDLMLAQADDLAGETVAVNLPGTDRERPNWRRRLSVDLSSLLDGPLAAAIIAAIRRERG
jgi:glycogen operon protein